MDVSVVVCTYNRSKLLKQCLESLEKQIVPEGFSWEVLVVNNNSTDDTKYVVEDIKKNSKLNIRYIFESKQGLSYARNRGVEEAKGEIVSFADDDCIVDSGWLNAIVQAFDKCDCDCVGGKITPIEWPKNIPKWFNKELYSYVAIYDKGNELLELTSLINTPFGANVSYKDSVFEKFGLFDTSLGRVGRGSASGGEEQDLNVRILKSGGRIFYQPHAIVYHPLRSEMFKKSYFRRLDFNTGMRSGFEFGEYNKRNFFGIPLFIINQFFGSMIRYIKYIFKNGYNNSFREELYCWYFLGFIWGRMKYWHGHKHNNLRV